MVSFSQLRMKLKLFIVILALCLLCASSTEARKRKSRVRYSLSSNLSLSINYPTAWLAPGSTFIDDLIAMGHDSITVAVFRSCHMLVDSKTHDFESLSL